MIICSIGSRERRAVTLADRRAQLAPRGKDGVRIDIAADLARDIGVARRHEHQRNKGRLERLIVPE